jgi:uncharacterized protein YkwD
MSIRTFGSIMVVLLGGSLVGAEPLQKKAEPKFELSEDEKAILEFINQARAKEKLPALKANPTLFKVARAHSKNMAKQAQMKHDLDDKTPAQRVEAAGYDYRSVGENIAAGAGWDVEAVFNGWMESQHHKDNILKKAYQEIGIGLATNDKGEVYYTQVFGTQRKKRQ